MKSLYLIIVCAFLLFSCQKVSTFDLENVAPEIIGNWVWIQTEYIESGTTLYDTFILDSEYEIKIENNGVMKFLRDGLLIEQLVIIKDNTDLNSNTYSFSLLEYDQREIIRLRFDSQTDELICFIFPFEIEDSLYPYNFYEKKD